MSREITVIKQQDEHSGRKQSKNDSLLSILHDKNKIIEKLQRQIHFQKLQLKYYLGKTFRNKKMIEFSKSCNSIMVEENIPIMFAVNRFCIQLGIKNKMFGLYERMCRIDGRINNLLRIQECLLRRVVEYMCDLVRKEKGLKMKIQIRSIISKPEYMHLFNNLLNTSVGLRKNLDTFRICCDRLLLIEEEKNSIAEQVYSLPVEQRTNCHYLIGIQIERVQLQNRLKEIMKDQTKLRRRIEQLNDIEGELKNLQAEYKNANKSCTEHMTDMLKRVNFEALALIAKSNQQKEKYTKEIVKLKCENQRILKLVEQLRASVKEKGVSKDSINLDTIFSAGLYQALDQEINQAIQDNEMTKDSRIENIRSECRELSHKLQNARNENSLLEKELENVKNEYAEARRQWENDFEMAQREKDEYKAQVEDLQAIRAAYAQLVDSRANMAEGEDRIFTGLHNKELERENLELKKELTLLKEETNKQKTKIRRLSEQILNFSGNSKVPGVDQMETKDVGSGDVGNETDSMLPKTNSCNSCGKKTDLERGIILQELQRSNLSQKDIQKLARSQKLDEITNNIIQDLTNSLNDCQCSTNCNIPLETSSDNRSSNFSTESKIFSTPEKSIISVGGINLEVPNTNIETTFQFHSSKQNNEETMKSILEGNCKVNEITKIRDKSLVSVKVRHMYPKKINKSQNSSTTDTRQKCEKTRESEVIENKIATAKQMVTFKNLENPQDVQDKGELKALKVTYRNPHECRTTTDSDPTIESQSSGIENCDEFSVKEGTMKLREIGDQVGQVIEFPFVKYDLGKRVKSLGDLQ